MPTLIVGGNSRLARRIAQALPDCRLVVRDAAYAQSGDVVTADYRLIPAAAFDGIEVVINCVGTPRGDVPTLQRINVEVPVAAAMAARAANCRSFIQVSSLSVYGRARTVDHGTATGAISAYGRSKIAADRALLALANHDFAVTLLRAPAIYGPGAAGKFGALAKVMRRIGIFPVPNPPPRRSALHLDNAAAAVVHLRQRSPATGVVFAADHQTFDLAALAASVTSASGRPVHLITLPRAAFELLRRLVPDTYASLYADSLIDPAAAMTTKIQLPVDLPAGLADMLASEWRAQ